MFTRSSLPSQYLNLLEKNYYCYVADWSGTAVGASTQIKSLVTTRSDLGHFLGWRIVSLNISASTTVTVSITNIGRYNAAGPSITPTNISATSVAVNSTTVLPGTYVIHTPTADGGSGILSIAAGDTIGMTLTFSSGGNTVSGRTWIFGYHLR